MIPDFLTYSSKTKRYYLGLLKVAGWGVKEGIKYGNIEFFFWTLAEARKWKGNHKV